MSEHTFNASFWKGSEKTAGHVREEIEKRWGREEAEKYDPLINCYTGATWHSMGYLINKGEHAIKSITLVDKEVEEDGKKVIRQIPKTVNLFYRKQVHRITP